jgi:hypothetical protein
MPIRDFRFGIWDFGAVLTPDPALSCSLFPDSRKRLVWGIVGKNKLQMLQNSKKQARQRQTTAI